MSVLIPASDKINADVAGMTWHEPQAPTAQPASPTEILHGFLHGESGELHYLWGSIPTPVVTPIETATDSRQGPHGGLVPELLSRVRPGPTQTPAPVVGPAAGRLADTVRNDAKSAIQRVRTLLGF